MRIEPTMARTWRNLLPDVIAGAVALVLSWLFVRTGTWSLFDEYAHLDYALKVGMNLALPPVNDLLGQEAMRAAVCDQAPGFAALAPACTAPVIDVSLGPYGGQNTATGYLPTSYLLTGIGARGLVALPGDLSWVHAARLIGSLTLAGTAALIVALGRRLGADPWVSAGLAILACSMPMVLLQFSTVNNDGLAVALTLAAVTVALGSDSTRAPSEVPWRWMTAFALAALAISAKETALIAVVAVLVLALREASRQHGGRLRRLVLAFGLATAAFAGPVLARQLAYPALVGVRPDNGRQRDAIVALQGDPSLPDVLANALQQVPSVFAVPQAPLAGPWFTVAALVVALLAFGLPLAMVLRTWQRSGWLAPRVLLAVTVLAFPAAFIAFFLLVLQVGGGPLFFQPRYLLPVVILAIAVAASAVRPGWRNVLLPAALGYATIVGVVLATSPAWAGSG